MLNVTLMTSKGSCSKVKNYLRSLRKCLSYIRLETKSSRILPMA